jgi:hypothetical protein
LLTLGSIVPVFSTQRHRGAEEEENARMQALPRAAASVREERLGV